MDLVIVTTLGTYLAIGIAFEILITALLGFDNPFDPLLVTKRIIFWPISVGVILFYSYMAFYYIVIKGDRAGYTSFLLNRLSKLEAEEDEEQKKNPS